MLKTPDRYRIVVLGCLGQTAGAMVRLGYSLGGPESRPSQPGWSFRTKSALVIRHTQQICCEHAEIQPGDSGLSGS